MNNPALQQAEQNFYSWLERNPDARTVPPFIQRYLDRMERHYEAERVDVKIDVNRWDMEEVCYDLDASLSDYEKRREAEQELAEYIRGISDEVDPLDHYKLKDVSDKLMNCRTSGTVGLKPDGGHIVAWDEKCSMVRLCPDESREETQRLAERYVPAIRSWLDEKKNRRAFYIVFTDHNYRPGTLRASKQYMINRVSNFLRTADEYCPVIFEDGPACKVQTVIKKAKGFVPWVEVVPGQPISTAKGHPIADIQGSFVCQEDPLSASDDWNVHTNAIVLVEGRFDYDKVREKWGANVHIEQIKKEGLVKSLLEVVKYSAQIVPSKTEEKKHKTDAPAMTQWSGERWIEWWLAQKGFRRVRSYGCLYRIKAPEKDLQSMEDVIWVGSLKLSDNGSYLVDLIQGYNFSQKRVIESDNRFDYSTGPPHPPPGVH